MKISRTQIFAILLFVFITFCSFFLRFRNYEEMINFHLDPPLFMHEVKDMVEQKKLRLIGPMVSSKVVEGRVIFTGPTFYWLLAVLGIIFRWNVVLMTGFFAVLWVVTFVLIFFWLKKRFSVFIAIFIYALISFFPWLLPYSRIIWNPNLVPFFGVLFFWFLEKREVKKIFWLLAGLAFGLSFSVHYASVILAFVIFYYWWVERKKKTFLIKNWFLLGVGFFLANLPLLLFELRHNFYNLRTIIFHLRYYQPSPGYTFDFSSQYYYFFFPFFPLFCKFYGLILQGLKRILGWRIFIASQIILVIILFIYSLFGPRKEALINPEGWTIKRQQQIADLIVADGEKVFEVAATVGPETRANELRWWLRVKNQQPLSVVDYEKTDILYLIAPIWRVPERETVWEVRVLRPFRVEKKIDLGSGLFFYKLVRQKMVK